MPGRQDQLRGDDILSRRAHMLPGRNRGVNAGGKRPARIQRRLPLAGERFDNLDDRDLTLMRREGIGFETEVVSDVAPLNGLVAALLEGGLEIHALRDPTRGGVAEALNEIAAQSRVEIEFDEGAVPVTRSVRSACDLLGLDPLHVANEGCALAFVPAPQAERALEILRGHPTGRGARQV